MPKARSESYIGPLQRSWRFDLHPSCIRTHASAPDSIVIDVFAPKEATLNFSEAESLASSESLPNFFMDITPIEEHRKKNRRPVSFFLPSDRQNHERIKMKGLRSSCTRCATPIPFVNDSRCRICRCSQPSTPIGVCGPKPIVEELVRPCFCYGSQEYVHSSCLVQWMRNTGEEECDICNYHFLLTPVPPKCMDWIKSEYILLVFLLLLIIITFTLLGFITNMYQLPTFITVALNQEWFHKLYNGMCILCTICIFLLIVLGVRTYRTHLNWMSVNTKFLVGECSNSQVQEHHGWITDPARANHPEDSRVGQIKYV